MFSGKKARRLNSVDTITSRDEMERNSDRKEKIRGKLLDLFLELDPDLDLVLDLALVVP